MALTLESVVGELDGCDGTPRPWTQVCEAIRHGSLMGARGNSGVILSQILRGLADTFSPARRRCRAPTSPPGLRRAADAAYEAVLRPVEGTILTVVRSAAESVERAVREGETTLVGVLERAAAAARDAVASTPDLLPVLREAGRRRRRRARVRAAPRRVPPRRRRPPAARRPRRCTRRIAVDAHAGDGDAAGTARRHRRPPLRGDVLPRSARRRERRRRSRPRGARSATRSSSSAATASGTATCTPTTSAPRSRRASRWAARATSASPTSSSRSPSAKRRRGCATADGDAPRRADARRTSPRASSRSRWATASARSSRGLGVQQVVAGGQSMNPSTAQILEAVDACVADGVIVLPNNKNIVPVAEQVPELTELPGGGGADGRGGRGARRAGGVRPRRLARRQPGRDGGGGGAGRVRARSRRRCATASAECGPIAAGDWIAITRDGISVAVKSASRRRGRAGRRAGRRRRRARHDHRRRRGRRRRHRAHQRAHRATRTPTSRSSCTTVTSRSTRTSSASSSPAPAPSRRARPHAARAGVAPRHRAEGGRRQARAPGSPRWASTTVLDLLEHYPRRYVDRTERAEIHELAIGDEATVDAEVRVDPRRAARATASARS